MKILLVLLLMTSSCNNCGRDPIDLQYKGHTIKKEEMFEIVDKNDSLTFQEKLELKQLMLSVKDRLRSNITADESQFLIGMAEISIEVILSGKQGVEAEKLSQKLGRKKISGVRSKRQAERKYKKIVEKVLTQKEIHEIGISFKGNYNNTFKQETRLKQISKIPKDLTIPVLEWLIGVLKENLVEK